MPLVDEFNLPLDVVRKLVRAVHEAKAVDYDDVRGGVCPVCGREKCTVTKCNSWSGDMRERWHRCQSCRHVYKSIQTIGCEAA